MQKRVYLDLQSLHAHRKISTEHSSWLGFDTVPTFTSVQPRSQSLTEALEFVLLPAADTGKDQQDKFANCSEVDGLQGWASERERPDTVQLCRHRSRVEIKEERIGERKKREEEEEGAMDKYVCLFYFILFYFILCYFMFFYFFHQTFMLLSGIGRCPFAIYIPF